MDCSLICCNQDTQPITTHCLVWMWLSSHEFEFEVRVLWPYLWILMIRLRPRRLANIFALLIGCNLQGPQMPIMDKWSIPPWKVVTTMAFRPTFNTYRLQLKRQHAIRSCTTTWGVATTDMWVLYDILKGCMASLAIARHTSVTFWPSLRQVIRKWALLGDHCFIFSQSVADMVCMSAFYTTSLC